MRVSPSARTAVTTSTRKTRRRGPAISACLSDPPAFSSASALLSLWKHLTRLLKCFSLGFPFQPLRLRFCWFLISRLSLSRSVLRSARAFSLSAEWRDLIPFRDFAHHWHARNKHVQSTPCITSALRNPESSRLTDTSPHEVHGAEQLLPPSDTPCALSW